VASLAAGYVLARLYLLVRAFVRDPASSTVLQFVSTFGVWLLSERLTLSPIITVVIYAMTWLERYARPYHAGDCICILPPGLSAPS
jgi:NhaP-type Na+/H+ or K+/H+ antiporter